MKKYLTHVDAKAGYRNSDGAYLVRWPEKFGDKILFYCDEWMILWTKFDDISNPDAETIPSVWLSDLTPVPVDEDLPEELKQRVHFVVTRNPRTLARTHVEPYKG